MSNGERQINTLWNQIVEQLHQVYYESATPYTQAYAGIHTNIVDYFKVVEFVDVENRMKNTGLVDQYYFPQYRNKGKEMYNHLIQLLKGRVTYLSVQCQNRGDKSILEFYDSEWARYVRSSNYVNDGLKYFNRYYILIENKRARVHHLAPFCDLVIDAWKNHFIEKFNNDILEAACQFIHEERIGEKITDTFISTLVQSYIIVDRSLTLYNDHFANKYVEEAEKFYIPKAKQYLQKYTMLEYAAIVKQRLLEESKRADLYLHKTTREPLIKVCRKALIQNHIQLFYQEFERLLNSNQHASLECLYCLVESVGKHELKGLATILEKYIKTQCLLAIEECCERAQKNLKIYVNTILELRIKYLALISNNLRNDDEFQIALNSGFKDFVNTNAITKITNNKLKSVEYIAKYCDMLLNKSNKMSAGDELNKALNEAIDVIQYIEDKDAFKKFYSGHLAKRLMQTNSFSDESETYMISQLKEKFGCGYMGHIEKMVCDIENSKKINEEFQAHITDSGEPLLLDFNIQILSICSWPYKISSPVILPLECEQAVRKFTGFYTVCTETRQRKKLTWMYNLSVGEITTNCYEREYTLIANTYQISIFFQFNQSETLTIGQLSESTSIKVNAVIGIVQNLLKGKWVICKEANNLTIDSVITINKNYKNKNLCLNIKFSLKEEAEVEQKRIYELIDTDKRNLAEAAIVRMLKSRTTMKHQQLFEEVLNQMKAMFVLEIALMEKCIKSLIDRQFIKRSPGDMETYNYLP